MQGFELGYNEIKLEHKVTKMFLKDALERGLRRRL